MSELPAPSSREIQWVDGFGRVFYGTITDYWEPMRTGTEAACGKDAIITFESSSGISDQEQTILKEYFESALGVKDVSFFKAGLDESTSRTVTWSAGSKTTISLNLIAPKCGSSLYELYRKSFVYRIKTKRKRFLRKPIEVNLPVFTERSETYIARIIGNDDHPNCPCGEKSTQGVPVRVKLGLSDRLTAFVDGFVDNTRGLRFSVGNTEYGVSGEKIFDTEHTFDMNDVPEFLITLGGSTSSTFTQVKVATYPDIDWTDAVQEWLPGLFRQPLNA